MRQNKIMDRRKPILIIQHAPHEHPAAIRRALETQGIRSLWIHPYKGDLYPDSPSDIRGLISLGGPMGANDEKEHPWIAPECLFMKKCVHLGMPVVGICLGAQMIAKATGGNVTRNKVAEVGWFQIELNSLGKEDPIAGASGNRPLVYHWHQDTFYLPENAQLLAASDACPRQAFKIGEKAYGFQFHPEADHQLIQEWLSSDETRQEISQVQKQHGVSTVQDVETQFKWTAEGEKASLKITAAISQLFKNTVYSPIHSQIQEHLENWASHETPLLLEYEGPDRKTHALRGKIIFLLTIPDGEFIIFKEETSLLWPIRMDHVKKAIPVV